MTSEPISIMIVDSQPITRAALGNVCSAEGINVLANISESQQALQIAPLLNPDLILFSINTAGFEELRVISILRRKLPKMRILVLITGELEGQERIAMNYGAHQVLVKTAQRTDIMKTVRALIH